MNMSITLSPVAAERVREFLQREQGEALRLGVKRTGCSGWAYQVSIAQAIETDDYQFSDQGLTIVVDPKSLPMVQGTQIDFASQGLNQSFVFKNPNVTGECGCGESFAVTPVTSDTPLNPF